MEGEAAGTSPARAYCPEGIRRREIHRSLHDYFHTDLYFDRQ